MYADFKGLYEILTPTPCPHINLQVIFKQPSVGLSFISLLHYLRQARERKSICKTPNQIAL